MRVKLLLFVVATLFLVSCSYTETSVQGKSVVYIVEEPKPLIFVVEHKDPFAWVKETGERRLQQNVERFLEEDEDELEEFEIKSKLSSTRRIIDDELIIGFDEDLDNPRLKDPKPGYDGIRHG